MPEVRYGMRVVIEERDVLVSRGVRSTIVKWLD